MYIKIAVTYRESTAIFHSPYCHHGWHCRGSYQWESVNVFAHYAIPKEKADVRKLVSSQKPIKKHTLSLLLFFLNATFLLS